MHALSHSFVNCTKACSYNAFMHAIQVAIVCDNKDGSVVQTMDLLSTSDCSFVVTVKLLIYVSYFDTIYVYISLAAVLLYGDFEIKLVQGMHK